MCEKQKYTSKRQAREAVRTMGNSVRVYYHLECGWYHVTKDRVKR
jgi:hypothetical protein